MCSSACDQDRLAIKSHDLVRCIFGLSCRLSASTMPMRNSATSMTLHLYTRQWAGSTLPPAMEPTLVQRPDHPISRRCPAHCIGRKSVCSRDLCELAVEVLHSKSGRVSRQSPATTFAAMLNTSILPSLPSLRPCCYQLHKGRLFDIRRRPAASIRCSARQPEVCRLEALHHS